MLLATMMLSGLLFALEQAGQQASATSGRLRVFLDCPTRQDDEAGEGCFEDFLREDVEIVDYVRDRADADVHVLVTRAVTSARGTEFTLSFLGQAARASLSRTLTITTEASDSEDEVRRRLASALTLGLLGFVASDALPDGLQVSAELSATEAVVAADADPWNRWIISVNGFGEVEAEESTRESDWGLSVGADRITPDWKISIGAEFNQSSEAFDLEEGDTIEAETRSREMSWLVVRAAGEHWSFGGRGQLRSSTFDNTELDVELAPAVEWNFFPYSMYTRRQLRIQYSAGAAFRRYYEVTLFDKTEETRGRQSMSTTYEQREPWGTLQGRLEFSNYFPGLSTNRLSIEGEVNLRIARGLSFTMDASASRIRDQLSLPRRGATPEEVLLRQRQLSSGFETRVDLGITYQFGSRFASIVNPRFGQE
jgi:hypothetical protein